MIARYLAGTFVLLALSVQATPVREACSLGSLQEVSADNKDTHAFGPIVEWRVSRDGTSRKAVLPFYARERDARGRDMTDILWPVGTISRWDDTTTWRFLTAFGYDYDRRNPDSAYRVWILPLLFWGRNEHGENYQAFFPLGGRIDGFLGRDVTFALFPLYAHSRLKDIDTHHYLWPLVSATSGRELRQFRVFPLYGHSIKQNEWAKRFVLWPFWTSARYEQPGARGSGFTLFPVFGHIKLENQETWMVFPPFFRRSLGRFGREGYYPWPFIQVSSGKVDKLYVWPLYGRRIEGSARKQFWLWPFIWQHHEVAGPLESDCFRLFPVLHHESSRTRDKATNVVTRYTSVWPLLSYTRKDHDTMRIRVLDLWPFRDTVPIERTLAPWWTIYRHERGSSGVEDELLWGLARWRGGADGAHSGSVFPLFAWNHDARSDTYREWDFLKGLIGYRRNEQGCNYRFLYWLHWRVAP